MKNNVKNFSTRIQTNIVPAMTNGVMIIQHINPLPGKSYRIVDLFISHVVYNVATAQFMNPELIPGLITGMEVSNDPAGGNPTSLPFAAVAPFPGVMTINGQFFPAYLKQHNKFDLSGIQFVNTTYYYFRYINGTLDQHLFYYNIYAKLEFDE